MLVHALIFTKINKVSDTEATNLRLLKEAAERQGHELKIISVFDCQMKFDKKPEIIVRGEELKDINIIIVKTNFLNDNLDFKSSIIQQFKYIKVPLINEGVAVMKAKNKLKTAQTLNRHNIPTPKTYIINSLDYLDEIISDIGYFPVILKTLVGSHGGGVSIIESKRGLKSVVEMMFKNSNPDPLIIQEYVKESKGKDIRVLILGHRIIAAMERIATKKGEFRSNFHLGGRVKVASMSKKEKEIAFAATKAIGLQMAGVDLLRTNDGPKVLEVNANPGLEGITEATGRDIAGEIIKFAVKKAKRIKRKRELNKIKPKETKKIATPKIS